MTNIYEISIVVPVYNSEKTLLTLTKEILKVAKVLEVSVEIIFVNDASIDNAWQVIQELVSSNENIIGINNSKNIGQVKTTNRGIERAKGKYVVTIDDDLEYPPSEIIKLYEKIKNSKLDIVFGMADEKYKKQGKNALFYILINRILNIIWSKPVTNSFKIFKRTFLFEQGNFMLLYSFEVYISKKLIKPKIDYINVDFNKRLVGKSNYSLIKKIKFILEMNKDFRK